MTAYVRTDHLLAAADLAAEALAPFAGEDWSVRAGPLEWDVERTISHMIGAPAKYTLYLASQSQTFIALSCSRFDDATHAELIASIRPVATGLANVARWVPPDCLAFHADGLTDPQRFISIACLELLVHTEDALIGLGGRLQPPVDLARAVLEAAYPASSSAAEPWPALIEASGRRFERKHGNQGER